MGVEEDGGGAKQIHSLRLDWLWSQVGVTASKPWQTPTVSFHLHGQRLRSGHPAYLAHCRPGKAEREKCWAQRRSELGPQKLSFAPSLRERIF